jgi:hypothetical protein
MCLQIDFFLSSQVQLAEQLAALFPAACGPAKQVHSIQQVAVASDTSELQATYCRFSPQYAFEFLEI